MLAAVLVAGGVVVAGYLSSTVRPLPVSSPPPPPAPIYTCQLGQLNIPPNCYNMQLGNVDLNLNTGNKFSTAGNESASIFVVSGSVEVTYLYSYDVKRYRAGQSFAISPPNIVGALEPNTKLQKRVW